jgi:hypothetical protein
LPVSRMWQWCVSRSNSAEVILASISKRVPEAAAQAA